MDKSGGGGREGLECCSMAVAELVYSYSSYLPPTTAVCCLVRVTATASL